MISCRTCHLLGVVADDAFPCVFGVARDDARFIRPCGRSLPSSSVPSHVPVFVPIGVVTLLQRVFTIAPFR